MSTHFLAAAHPPMPRGGSGQNPIVGGMRADPGSWPPQADGRDPAHRGASAWSDRLGLCSVTLRRLPVEEVLAVASRAGLSRIEWGADVHAPPDDLARLREVRRLTEQAGLEVASYGSYWRAGTTPLDELAAVVAGAEALGAPRVRVWAGGTGAEVATDETWSAVVRALREGCRLARDHGVELALEFHPNTLTDSADSTLELLDRVGDPGPRTYWQPRLDEEVGPAVAGLQRLLPFLSGVHVFSWWPGATRLRLDARSDLWSAVVELLVAEAPPCDLLLEFVPDDDPELVVADAGTLRDLVAAAR